MDESVGMRRAKSSPQEGHFVQSVLLGGYLSFFNVEKLKQDLKERQVQTDRLISEGFYSHLAWRYLVSG